LKINNRRYLGNKYKLTDFIKQVVEDECKDVNTVFDVFAGTGAVASAFIDKSLIVNDILYSNHLAHLTWFSSEPYDVNKISSIIQKYNNLKSVTEDNYMSLNFSDTYFSGAVCKKIGYIRDDIEFKYNDKNINKRERAMLVTSLIYALDKIANTCGHYDAYRKGVEYNNNFIMEVPEIENEGLSTNKLYNIDSNELVKKVKCDLAYLDPPYNSRQYCDAYHLLENIARWEKPAVSGVAKKMDRTNLKSNYCTTKATKAFVELIENLQCKYIILSYNNTGHNANDRSNAKITDDDIKRILNEKGKVKIFSQSYKAFTTGKSENDTNEERLFLCVVKEAKKLKKKDTSIISSPLNYTGGKAKLLSQIKPLFLKNIDNFVDLFCGGCNVGINISAKNYFYNDICNDLIGLYSTFIDTDKKELFEDFEKIISKYKLSDSASKGYKFYGCNSSDGLCKYNKDKYAKLKSDFNTLTIKDKNYYEMFYILIVYGFNNQIRFNKEGHYNLPVGKRDFNIKIKTRLSSFVDRLKEQNPIITSNEFNKFDFSGLTTNSLVYCDPPYLIATASYNENGGWTKKNEKNLLSLLDRLNAQGIKFALSNILIHKGKVNKLLDNWVNKNSYNVHHLDYNYNNSNYHSKNTDEETDEVLITNY